MIGLLLALYPAPWRRRYGEEFRAVLESRAIGPFDVADILLGALDARARAVLASGPAEHHGGRNTMLRLGGFGAIAGGTSWVGGFVGASVLGDGAVPWTLLIAVGTIGILLALIGLSAFQAHRSPRLVWAAFLIPGLGSVVSMVGLIGMMALPNTDDPMIGEFGAWAVWAIGALAMLVGCVLFATATYRARVLSRRAAVSLGGSSLALLVLTLAISARTDGAVGVLLAGILVVFAGSWAALGIGALRRGPIQATTTA